MKIPRPYQLKAIQSCKIQNTLICDEPGLGKTVQAVLGAAAFCETLHSGHRLLPVLVLCRKIKREDWIEEIADTTPYIPAFIVDRAPLAKPGLFCFIITHYESIVTYRDEWKRLGLWACIIVDEIHHLRNRDTKRSIAIKSLKTMRKIGLTGTPIDKSASEAWSILNWLYPHFFRSYRDFVGTHGNYREVYTKQGKINKPAAGVRDHREYTKILAPFTFQRTKTQVAPDLPLKIIKKQMIDLLPDHRSLYDLINQSKDIEVTINDKDWLFVPNELAKIIYLQKVTSSPECVDLNVSNTKLLWLTEYYYNNQVPIIIFTRFIETAKIVGEMLDIPQIHSKSHDTIKSFTSGEKRGMVGTIDAIGEGLNLQCGNVSIFIDQHWSSIKMGQAIERSHRMDITDPKYIIYLVARNTVDELIHQSFTGKWKEQELIRTFLSKRH